MKIMFTIVVILFAITLTAQNNIPSKEWQIKTAVLAVPEDYRAEAMVYGYNTKGEFTVLREGTNQYVCIADDPNKSGFEAAAYHKDLDLFMARGRELKAQGKGFKEIFDTREAEVRSGVLKMPASANLIIFTGSVNEETKAIDDQRTRYVFYLPFATAESTGLPTSPKSAGHPWIMNPGTHRAHIMISPTYPKKKK
jgi:hypothetical protein